MTRHEASKDSLSIRLLGEFEVLKGGVPVALPPSRKTRALLAYLVVTGRRHRRERLCRLLWEDPDDPRGSLRWSLSRLRPLVDQPDRERILADRDFVAFDASRVLVDLAQIRRELVAGPDVVSRGFVYMRQSDDLIDATKNVVRQALNRNGDGNTETDSSFVNRKIKDVVSEYLYGQTKRRPMVLPVVMEV